MSISRIALIIFGALVLSAPQSHAAVKLTALQIISSDANGKIQGVGGHRFKTSNHGGHPCIYLVKGDDMNGEIINPGNSAKNSIEIPLSAGNHTYTVFAEKANSYSWTNYTMSFFFDLANQAQISALAPLNTNSTQFFPEFTANKEFTEDLQGHSVKAPGSLVYKSGDTQITLTAFHFSAPTIFNKDRISPFSSVTNKNLDYVGQFTLEVKAPPQILNGGVVNAGSFSAKVAPGSLFSIFGDSLATATEKAPDGTLPSNIAGTSVAIGGRPAPLAFVSPGQINAQVPYEIMEGSNVPVVVTVHNVASNSGKVNVVAASPGIFQYGEEKRAVAQNQDYSINSAENGARAGEWMIAYMTGGGHVDNPVPTGSAARVEPLSRPKAIVVATVNGMAADVLFAGLTPDYIGLMQINLRLPNLAPGNYPLVVMINGEKSNAAVVSVK